MYCSCQRNVQSRILCTFRIKYCLTPSHHAGTKLLLCYKKNVSSLEGLWKSAELVEHTTFQTNVLQCHNNRLQLITDSSCHLLKTTIARLCTHNRRMLDSHKPNQHCNTFHYNSSIRHRLDFWTVETHN